MKNYCKKLSRDNRGSAMIMALAIISLIAILGVMAMETALLNLKMRSLNQSSDKNFYLLETALDEIYAQVGRMSGEILKEEYASVMGSLYRDDIKTNQAANRAMREGVASRLAGEFGVLFPQRSGPCEEDRKRAAEKLKGFSDTLEKENLTVTVDSVFIEKQKAGILELPDRKAPKGNRGESQSLDQYDEEMDDTYRSFILKGVSLTYVNPETQIESALTVDLKIKIPYVRFINEGSALLDYILAANQGITVSGENVRLEGESVYTGNIYGGAVTIDNAKVTTAGRLMTAAGNLTIKNRGALTIGPDAEQGGTCRVFAHGIQLNLASSLTADDTSFFVKDDLTLNNNENKVLIKHSGSYYGYGNEGEGGIYKETPVGSNPAVCPDEGKATQAEGEGGIFINTDGRIFTSGSLYQVAGAEEGERRFELISNVRRDGGDIGSAFSFAEFAVSINESFENLKENLDEADRVKGRAEIKGARGEDVPPVGNYVKLYEVRRLNKPAYWEKENCRIFISGEDVTLQLSSAGNHVLSDGEEKKMDGGLIVSAGNVTVTADNDEGGSFDGLIISAGTITIKGNAVLTANAQTYEPLLDSASAAASKQASGRGILEDNLDSDEKRRVSDFFYDYSDAASTFLNDYQDFVIRENWVRAGRNKDCTESEKDSAGNGEGIGAAAGEGVRGGEEV